MMQIQEKGLEKIIEKVDNFKKNNTSIRLDLNVTIKDNEILDDKIVNKTIRDLKTKIILDKTIPNSNKTFLNNF